MSDVIGVPDFSRMTKGTRHGREKVSKRDFDLLAARVVDLERAVRELQGKPRIGRPKREIKSSDKPTSFNLDSA